ncbi:MAG TPA: sigma 54-interacting transcriptional regulator [Terracidiphilus sp.]|nr:sigma 54-interacting transcriptional regulator [Terracidiphilus sp.]
MRPSDPPEKATAATPSQDRATLAQTALENLFDVSPDAIFVTDAHGLIHGANPRAAELFGYSQAELFGQPIENLVPERYRGRHPSHRENYNAHPRARQMGAALNLFGLRKDGTEFPVDIMLKPIETASGPVVLSFVRDVSEQRAAIEEMRRSDQQLRSIVESVRDYAIYLLDPEGSVMTWNPGAERLKQYSVDEILGMSFSRFFTQEDIDRGRPAEILRLAAQRGRFEEEGWRIRKDGSRFWAHATLTAIRDTTGTLTGFAKVTQDTTESKQAQESVIAELSSLLLSNVDISKLLGAFSASIRQIVPHDLATLGLYDESTGKLRVQFLSAAGSANPGSGEVLLDPDASPAGRAFRTRQPLIMNKVDRWPFAPQSIRHLTDAGMQSGIWVPLIHRERTLGTLMVASRTENAFVQHDAEMLGQVAGQVAMAVNNALAFKRMAELRDRLNQEKEYLESEINLENRYEDIVGESKGLRQVLREIETVAPTDATVLIQGESGTGKELLARAIHRLSSRSEHTFIKLNCAAIPAGLLESELFGHEKGAFTGAIARKIGRVELAHEGTLFLDEVGELPLDLQPKLLRALQEREIERLGGIRPILVNMRLIAATNRDLSKMVAEKTFRADLYYRLKVFPVFAPPLRERVSDIPILVRHFVATHSRRMGKTIESIPDETMRALIRWRWPGNIRELENFLERAVILTRGSALYVPLAELQEEQESPEAEQESPTLHAAEREHILRVLRETKGQIGGDDGAAARLGLKRTTLNSKLKKLGIERADYM